MKRLMLVVVLILLMICPAYAGEMDWLRVKGKSIIGMGASSETRINPNGGAFSIGPYDGEDGGTTSKFLLNTDSDIWNDFIFRSYNTNTNGNAIVSQRAYGTLAAPEALAAGSVIFTFGGEGYDGNAWRGSNDAVIQYMSTETFSTLQHPTKVRIVTTRPGATTRVIGWAISDLQRMSIGSDQQATSTFYVKPTENFGNAYYFNGSTYTNVGPESRTTFGTAVTILADTDDFLYMGVTTTVGFPSSIYFELSTTAVGAVIKLEYWNGTGWTELSITDGTSNLTQSGIISFTRPTDYATTTVNGIAGRYWLRLSTTNDPSTDPKAYNIIPEGGVYRAYILSNYGDTLPAFYVDNDAGVGLYNGIAINEFSSDGNMSGDSDLAVPTEKAVKTYVDNVTITADRVIHNTIGTPTYSTAEDHFNLFVSAGRVSGGEITDAGGATVNIAAGTGVIRILDNDVADVKFFNWEAAAAVAITTDTIKFIGIEYNDGSPQIVVRDNQNWDFDTDFPLGMVLNEDDSLHIVFDPWWVSDVTTNIIERFNAQGIVRDERIGGLIISDEGSLNVALTEGTLWHRLNEFEIDAVNTTGTDTIGTYYYNGSVWVLTEDVNNWDNVNYNNVATGLVGLGNNQYANLWWYVTLYGELIMVYGQTEFPNIASAEVVKAPSFIPDEIQYMGALLGRFIIKQGVATAVVVETAWAVDLTGTGAFDHGNLAGLLDDDHTQYWNDERGQDAVDTMIQDGTGISWAYDDGAGTLTPTVSIPNLSGEYFYVTTLSGNLSNEVVLSAGEGIDLAAGAISGEDATSANKGIASFSDTGNITVSSGDVSLNLAAGDTYSNFGDGDDDTLDELFIAIDTAWPSGGTPADDNGAIQYNDSGSFGGDDTKLFFDSTNGYLGIGTNTPGQMIEIHKDGGNSAIRTYSYHSFATSCGTLNLGHARGTGASASVIENGDWLGQFSFLGYDGNSFGAGARVYSVATENFVDDANYGSKLVLGTVVNGTTTLVDRMTINNDGNIGIGTTTPDYMFEVVKDNADSIICTTSYGNTAAETGLLRLRRAKGSEASPSAVTSGYSIGRYVLQGYDGSNFIAGAQIYAEANEDWSVGNNGSKLIFKVTPNGSATPELAMSIGQDKSVVVYGASNSATMTTVSYSDTAAHRGYFIAARADGTEASPGAIDSGDGMGGILFGGYATSLQYAASISTTATENWGVLQEGCRMDFQVTSNVATTAHTVLTLFGTGGVLFAGNDVHSVDYAVPAAGKYRILYVNQDGYVVVGDADLANND